ncbi:hypothetical protein B0H16DRAFT_1628097 [Mycena metata]|uniref:Uncharacterized protein n=1 Tax=Mycena metata TaxID=1033252 RepID=A0AAD7H3M8_9AGAR|nr:hypothetical protein B0H16DRAFT_1628097 [Mycena metata]
MPFPHFRSVAPKVEVEGDGSAASIQDDESAETLLQMSRKGPNQSGLQSSGTLPLLSLVLHSALVGIHLTLLGIWERQLEHRIIFSLDDQKIVNLLITAIATAFGTTYSALLVFVTQRLSIRRSLQIHQTITATHDSATAWAGFGSALAQLSCQKTIPGSIGVLSAFLYLGNILVLHITTPALFSFQTFKLTSSYVRVATRSLPTYNFPQYNVSDPYALYDALLDLPQLDYVTGSLYILPAIMGSNTSLGLTNGTLYDVLDVNPGVGNVTVNATGFDIACGYPTNVHITPQKKASNFTWYYVESNDTLLDYAIPPTQRGIISFATNLEDPGIGILILNNGSIFTTFDIYSTIPILDSNNSHLAQVDLTPPMNTFSDPISSIQLLQCSLSLVSQQVVVDAQSRQFITVEPDIHKTSSTWLPNVGIKVIETSTENVFLQAWAQLYSAIPQSTFARDPAGKQSGSLSVADLYLNQKLTLNQANDDATRSMVMLHDLENTLSSVVASMFWTLGNIPPQAILKNADDGTIQISTTAGGPTLLQGHAEVPVTSVQGRLDLSVVAISAGLAASVALFLLSLLPSLFLKNRRRDTDVPIDGIGMLHAIWLYRNHPELQTLMEQVDEPTEANLREAGMVRTRLIGGDDTGGEVLG